MIHMSGQHKGWLGAVCLAGLAAAAFPAAARGAVEEPDLAAVVKDQGSALAQVKTDAEALSLFNGSLGPALGLGGGREGRGQTRAGSAVKPKGAGESQPAMPPDQAQAALQLTRELAAWRLAAAVKEGADGPSASLQPLLTQAAPQREWLTGGDPHRPWLRRALSLADLLAPLETTPADAGPSPPGYEDFAARLDRQTPLLATGDQESWVRIAEQEGLEGIRRRLAEAGQPLADRYVKVRLRPVLTAQALALALRAEAEAERHSRLAWQQLRAWPERLRQEQGLARLCGSWQWTIHNHQNHQDHKLVMRFEPPFTQAAGETAGGQPMLKPARIVVLGDAVYLRWESAGGAQEDSLLFTGEGKRLEGSFTNSAGAWGSITGKRVSGCATKG